MLITRSMITLATASADLLRIGVKIAYRVKWSIMDRTYLHCAPTADVEIVLYSTKKSIDILSNGRWTGMCPVGSVGCLCSVFLRWHAWHLRHQLRLSRAIVGHQYICRISAYVGRFARCPRKNMTVLSVHYQTGEALRQNKLIMESATFPEVSWQIRLE